MTVVFGIPIPSTDPVFLGIVGIHIAFGLTAFLTGAVSMLSKKGRGRHSRFGTYYFWSLAGVFVTMAALSFMRWAQNYDLFMVGTLSFATCYIGREMARRHPEKWPSLHLWSMGASFIMMLTGFYVDNGPNLPVWREFPPIIFWFLPTLIGVPIILWVWSRPPLIKAVEQGLGD